MTSSIDPTNIVTTVAVLLQTRRSLHGRYSRVTCVTNCVHSVADRHNNYYLPKQISSMYCLTCVHMSMKYLCQSKQQYLMVMQVICRPKYFFWALLTYKSLAFVDFLCLHRLDRVEHAKSHPVHFKDFFRVVRGSSVVNSSSEPISPVMFIFYQKNIQYACTTFKTLESAFGRAD